MQHALTTRQLQDKKTKFRTALRFVENMLKPMAISVGVLSLLALSVPVLANDYETRVVVSGLDRPTGIAVEHNSTLFITQLPTPGISGPNGGSNTVDMIRLDKSTGNAEIVNLTTGEPEPTNLTLDKHDTLYWTCKSAGVILERSKKGTVSLFLGGLVQPSGISADKRGNIYFTQLPTPGISGMNGGFNTVNVSDGDEIEILTLGEPEPTDIVVSKDGDAYWTCKSAGVILKHNSDGVVSLVLNNLLKPTGIAIDKQGRNLFFTEVPTPGISGQMGGMNRVSRLDLETGEVDVVNFGDPEPTDIAVNSNGDLYWTCSSAGVIVEASLIKD
jgi:streptogramin lyase